MCFCSFSNWMSVVLVRPFSYHTKHASTWNTLYFAACCRIVWFILFFISLVGFLFVFARGVIQYRSYPVATKIEYHTSSHIQFPSVTICNRNFIRKSFTDAQTIPGLHKAIRSLNFLINTESYYWCTRHWEYEVCEYDQHGYSWSPSNPWYVHRM